MFVALLDTSVLWPSRQRDFLLSLAAEHFYRPIWSGAILDELREAEEEKLVDMNFPIEVAQQRAARLIERMRDAFEDAEVEGWQPLEGSFDLRDPDDEHVLAAAVVGQAGAIVTCDRDFEPEKLPAGMDVLRPPEFALNNVSLNPRLALRAVEEMASRLGVGGPAMSVEDILNLLDERYGMSNAVLLMRESQ